MIPRDQIERDMTRINNVIREVEKDSDRSAVIITGAEADIGLKKILEAFLIPAANKDYDIFRPDSALGTFSSRIEIMNRLGLIPNDWHHDLHVYRKIRNKFAHAESGLNFENQQIKDLIANLIILENMRQSQIEKIKKENVTEFPDLFMDSRSN